MADRSHERRGLLIEPVSEKAFRDFASRHATSPEVGRIATCFDAGHVDDVPDDDLLLGLSGCGTLGGVVCCTLHPSKRNDSYACKLDSVIVDQKLRKRGLAGLLVAEAFAKILSEAERTISSLYAHSVHPASVKLLRRLAFRDPSAVGAPISSYPVDDKTRTRLLALSQQQGRSIASRLKLECAFCRSNDRRANPWCRPAGSRSQRRTATLVRHE